jgi:hypothetical protein
MTFLELLLWLMVKKTGRKSANISKGVLQYNAYTDGVKYYDLDSLKDHGLKRKTWFSRVGLSEKAPINGLKQLNW